MAQVRIARERLLRVWRGRYVCGQGETGVRLSLLEIDDRGTITGLFSFFNLPGRGNARQGQYTIIGHFDPDTDTLNVAPDEWVWRPDAYVMVGFTAAPDATFSHIEGTFVGLAASMGCTRIALD